MSEAVTEIDFDRKHIQRLQEQCDELRRKYEEAVVAGDRLAWERDEALAEVERLQEAVADYWPPFIEMPPQIAAVLGQGI